MFEQHRLELFYTGSLYSFRRVDALLGALASNPALRLSIAAVTVPEHVLAASRTLPAQIRLLGFMPHTAILELQREADVLVNLANADMTQVPGKIFEYLGAARPILHLGSEHDPAGALIQRLRRGWVCDNGTEALVARLHGLVRAKAESRLELGLQLELAPVMAYSWREIAAELDQSLRALRPAHS
jgi:glycosyltransferase involved in cell wall biosynthesis